MLQCKKGLILIFTRNRAYGLNGCSCLLKESPLQFRVPCSASHSTLWQQCTIHQLLIRLPFILFGGADYHSDFSVPAVNADDIWWVHGPKHRRTEILQEMGACVYFVHYFLSMLVIVIVLYTLTISDDDPSFIVLTETKFSAKSMRIYVNGRTCSTWQWPTWRVTVCAKTQECSSTTFWRSC